MALTDSDVNNQRDAFWNQYGVRRNKIQGDVETNLLGAAYPGAKSAFDFGSQMEGQRQNDLRSMINMFSPQNQANLVGQFGRQQAGMANDRASQLQAILGMKGGGIGAQQGAAIQAVNNANKSTSDYAAHLQSPEGQQQIAALLQQLYSQAQTNPMLQQILPFLQEMSQARQFQQANQNSQGSIFGGLLGAAGSLAGAGAFNGLFGGSSKPAGQASGQPLNMSGYGLSQMLNDFLANYGTPNYGVGSVGGPQHV